MTTIDQIFQMYQKAMSAHQPLRKATIHHIPGQNNAEQAYLSLIHTHLSAHVAEILLFENRYVERNSLILLTRSLADCVAHFTRYLALKGTLEITYLHRANQLTNFLRRALANDPPLISCKICRIAQKLSKTSLTINISDNAIHQDADLSEILAYRPAASVRLQEVVSLKKSGLQEYKRCVNEICQGSSAVSKHVQHT